MNFENELANLENNTGEMLHAKTQYHKWRNRIFELNRERKRIIRAIDRMTQRLLKVNVETSRGVVSEVVSAEIVHEVEDRMNQAQVMEHLIEARFAAQAGRITGERAWQDLKEATIKRRIKENYGEGPILVNEGLLRQAAVEAAAGTFKLEYEEMEWPDISELDVDYAAAQNYGYAANNLPARPFWLRPTRAEMREIYSEARRLFREIRERRIEEVNAELANK